VRVFLVTDYFRPGIGGLETSTAYLASALQAYVPAEILTAAPPGDSVEESAIAVRRFSASEGAPYDAMRRYIAGHPAPRAVCFFGFSDKWTDSHLAFVDDASRSLAAKVTFKIPSLNEFPLYVTNGERRGKLDGVTCFVCPSNAIREQLISVGIPSHRTVCRPNGVPTDVFVPASPQRKSELRSRLGLGPEPVFIFTGRFAARKRVDLLVEAFRRIREATLVLVGYFDNRFDQGSSFELAGARNIRVFGPTHDVVPYLQAADVFVSASAAEGMPNSLLEAFSCGLAGLVTAIPGHLEVVEPEVNGRVFQPGSVEDLVHHARRMIREPQTLAGFSRRARQTAVTKFSIDAVARAYHDLLTGGGA
jgi:glycosyltransferase involved in cell wall biosynthesis